MGGHEIGQVIHRDHVFGLQVQDLAVALDSLGIVLLVGFQGRLKHPDLRIVRVCGFEPFQSLASGVEFALRNVEPGEGKNRNGGVWFHRLRLQVGRSCFSRFAGACQNISKDFQ